MIVKKLYPFKFKPIFKEKIWGGKQIKTKLKMDYGNFSNCGEVWVVSGVEGNVSKVENGYFLVTGLPSHAHSFHNP